MIVPYSVFLKILFHVGSLKRLYHWFIINSVSGRWIVEGNERLPYDPAFLCDSCFRGFHFDASGNKIGTFRYFPYPQTSMESIEWLVSPQSINTSRCVYWIYIQAPSARTKSAARSATAINTEFGGPDGRRGKTLASTTRRPFIPRTLTEHSNVNRFPGKSSSGI